MLHDKEVFGTEEQRALMRRAQAMRVITRDDPRFSFYGRQVSVTDWSEEAEPLVLALARLQGAGSCLYVPEDRVQHVRSGLEAAGMKTDRFRLLRGEAEALEASRRILETRDLPGDLEVVAVDADTPPAFMAEIDAVTGACGVLLPMGSVMRGREMPSVCLVARDGTGAPVATAAAVAINHPCGTRPADAWWGLLATREDRRGEGIALALGARAILAMHDRHGFSAFMTGVRQGNAASEGLCAKLAIVPSGYDVVAAIDPASFAGERVTK